MLTKTILLQLQITGLLLQNTNAIDVFTTAWTNIHLVYLINKPSIVSPLLSLLIIYQNIYTKKSERGIASMHLLIIKSLKHI